MRFEMRCLLVFGVCFLYSAAASAQVSIAGPQTTINFTGFDGSGFAPTPAVGQLDSDDWRITGLSDGDSAFGDTNVAGDFARGTSGGGVSGGGIYSFTGFNGATLFGVQPTGGDFTPGEVILRVQNNTGNTITQFTVNFDGHLINNGDRSSTVVMGHSSDDITYTDLAATTIVTPETSDALGWIGGVPLGDTFSVNIANGDFYYIRWMSTDSGGAGSRDEFGLASVTIDAVTMSVACTVNADCDDGAFCNGAETCDPLNANADAMGCVAGTDVVVDDGKSCTADSCDEVNDVVVNAADNALCDDGAFCNGAETCDPADANSDAASGCLAGTPVVVDDGVGCTMDSCDEANDMVVNTASDALCDDNDLCTSEVCDAVNDCQFTAVGCTINATCYADGDPNPNNPCEACVVATATDDWSALPENSVCGMAMCSIAELTPAPTCDAAGACIPGTPEICVNGCMAGMCVPPCQSDADCAIGWCDLANGGACSTENRAPVAVIEPIAGDIIVDATGGTFVVDGSGSSDPDGDAITYAWEIVSGGALTFDDATAETPTVTIPAGVVGTVEVGLTVNDATVDSVQVVETVMVVLDNTGEDMGVADMGGDMGNANNANNANNQNNANNANNQNNANNSNNDNPDMGGDMATPTKPADDDGCCATANSREPTWMLFLFVAVWLIRRRRK